MHLPHVARETGNLALGHRRASIARRHDLELALLVLHEPAPARAKRRQRRLAELLLERRKRAKVLVDLFAQRARRLAAALDSKRTKKNMEKKN